jgi:hypothetical protein
VFPVAGMTLGYPLSPLGKDSIRPRLDLSALVHREHYRPVAHDELLRYDRVMRETGIYRGRKMAGTTRSDESYGWLEHSALRVHQESRQHLREVLLHQGFPLS